MFICAALWCWIHSEIWFSADQIFLGSTAVTDGIVALIVVALYFLILPLAVLVSAVLLLWRLYR
jgi:hypothetical protein